MAENGVAWWAKGEMFENCNCRLLCRCHISYRQPADHERCTGCFAIEVAEGRYGEVALDRTRAFLAVDAPQNMLSPTEVEQRSVDVSDTRNLSCARRDGVQ